jgi:phosphorylase kinase alpha/beta subunit
MTFHNSGLAGLVPDGNFCAADLQRIRSELISHDTLTFVRLPSGLYSASSGGKAIAGTGYANVWIRDNIYVAYAHHVVGSSHVAVEVVRALTTFFSTYRRRFDDIISGAADPDDATLRPHVRFDGLTLSEIGDERWAHAQNDALGYFLWLSSTLAAAGALKPDAEVAAVLTRLLRYLDAIRFWQDEDSGHWEERRKLSASSIGTVVAGLDAFLALMRQSTEWREQCTQAFESLASDLAARGRQALDTILPQECAQLASAKNRRYDAALLFLLFPLQVVTDEAMADLILHDVRKYLAGEHGIRRYLGDSYWAPDYEDRLPAADRTRDFSDDIEARDALLPRIGDEAQWCLFDPIISAYFGCRYRRTGSFADREQQIIHFNRTLAQITDDWRCPELYYLRRSQYVANPHVPLQWTQANLVVALDEMRASLD